MQSSDFTGLFELRFMYIYVYIKKNMMCKPKFDELYNHLVCFLLSRVSSDNEEEKNLENFGKTELLTRLSWKCYKEHQSSVLKIWDYSADGYTISPVNFLSLLL